MAQFAAPTRIACLTALVGGVVQIEYVAAQSRDADLQPYELEATYTADVWRNMQGGIRTGGAYLDNLDVTLSVDGERAWGVRGLSAFAYALYNNDARFSQRYVGDAMTVSNIDAPEAARLYEAWIQWESASTHLLSLRFGLYDLNSEFDTSDSRSLFIHSTHGVGHELGQTGENGPSIFPVTSPGLRAAWSPAENWRVLVALLDAVPGDPDHPSATRVDLSSEEGALGVSEVQWSGERITKLSLGHWRYTADFEDLRSTHAERRPERDDNHGAYAAIEFAIGPVRAATEPVTLAFARYGVANGRINEFRNSLGVGLRRRGLVAGRPDDELGLAYSRTDVGSATRSIAAATGQTRDRYEAALELTYRAALTDWLIIQPDIQYVFNPGADPSLDDALAIGLRLEFSAAVWR
ncbi:MAG: carbohydrate porin [Steroidobacter sp.]